MKKLSEYKTFIFDLDDTLYDYSACDRHAYDEVAHWLESKFSIDYDSAHNAIKHGKMLAKSGLDSGRSSYHCRFLYFQKTAEMLQSNNIIYDTARMYSIYNNAFYKSMKPYSWVIDFFKTHNCCICTNMIAEVQFNKLIVLGLADYVKLIVTSEEAYAEKPDDAIYILLINKLRNYGVEIGDCLFIGDNEEHDVLGPRDVGFDSMHIKDFLNKLNTELK